MYYDAQIFLQILWGYPWSQFLSHTRDSASFVHNHILYNEKMECQRGLIKQRLDLERETKTKGLRLPTLICTIKHESVWSN